MSHSFTSQNNLNIQKINLQKKLNILKKRKLFVEKEIEKLKKSENIFIQNDHAKLRKFFNF